MSGIVSEREFVLGHFLLTQYAARPRAYGFFSIAWVDWLGSGQRQVPGRSAGWARCQTRTCLTAPEKEAQALLS